MLGHRCISNNTRTCCICDTNLDRHLQARANGVQFYDENAIPKTDQRAGISFGRSCVIFFAALRQVPQEQIEAARIEGATYVQMMRYVLLPGIRPTITLMMIMTVIWSFLAFDFVYILTQGGPAFSSELLSTLAYRKAFYDLNVGQAAAAALVISLFGLIGTFFYVRIQTREGEQ